MGVMVDKPDWKDAPGWANWLAMDEDRCWCWHEFEPDKDLDSWESSGLTKIALLHGVGDWNKSLEFRKEHKVAKEKKHREDYFQDRMIRRVICAACKYPSGLIIFGARHFDTVMTGQLKALKEAGANLPIEHEQGFIDQYGVFMDRKEAMQVAKDAGQAIDIRFGCGGDELTLYSEGLY